MGHLPNMCICSHMNDIGQDKITARHADRASCTSVWGIGTTFNMTCPCGIIITQGVAEMYLSM